MNILILSNGYGEDHIACNLIKSFKKRAPNATFSVIPLVGEGIAYKTIDIEPILKNKLLPSGGFLRKSFDLLKDLFAGLWLQLFTQLKTIRNESKKADLTICVGDVFCLSMGRFFNSTPIYFLPTAKSNLFMPHSWLEYILIKKWTKMSFTRDKETSEAFENKQCNARFLGNPMMDNLLEIGSLLSLDPNKMTLGILPGSREEAYKNFDHCLQIVEYLEDHHPIPLEFIVGKASSIDIKKLCKKSGWNSKKGSEGIFLTHPTKKIDILITDAFNSVINQSDILIGLSGTANEQATYIGKKVICFEGFGPQTTFQRFKEQEKLLGKNLLFVANNDPKNVADFIIVTLHDIKKSAEKPAPHKAASPEIIKTILGV
ncbi:hypothetical protein DID80_04270 [Candidatus Marinamargulisbacteria bacterium SCGC AAA071-K20]|nr:hypothetical protein DID80_04270 [Candidatus Marinamargulisbacteria bacterium SCGC AAA071-K20]